MAKQQFGLSIKRSCTDVLCIILFALLILSLVGFCTLFFLYGDIKYLIYPIDSSGRICGVDNGGGYDYTGKGNLLQHNFVKCFSGRTFFLFGGCPGLSVCVETCPSTYMLGTDENVEILKEKGFCVSSNCPPYVLSTTSILNNCVPSLLQSEFSGEATAGEGAEYTELLGRIYNVTKHGVYENLKKIFLGGIVDIITVKFDLLIFFAVCVFICFTVIMLLRWFTGPVILISFISVIGCLGVGSAFLIQEYVRLKESGADPWPNTITVNLGTYGGYYNVNLMFGIILALLDLILLIIIFGCFKSIRIAVQLIKETSKALGYIWWVYMWILVPVVEMAVVTSFCIVVAAYLQTIGRTTSPNSLDCDMSQNEVTGSTCRFLKELATTGQPYLLAYLLFAWFWMIQFIDDFSTCVISGSFSQYYWALNKPEDIPISPVIKSFFIVSRYHLGSVALGSLIIALVKFFRACLIYASKKLKKFDNKIVTFIFTVLKCCFWCLEKILKFIVEEAYIQMMICGKNFCTSAKNAFFLKVNNLVGNVVTVTLAKLIVVFCSLGCTFLTTLLSYVWFTSQFDGIKRLRDMLGLEHRKLNYELIPTIFVGIVSLLTSRYMLKIFQMGISTLFSCYIIDVEENDGTAENPYYMGKKLMRLLKLNNSKQVSLKK